MTDVSCVLHLQGVEPIFGLTPCVCGTTPELGELNPLFAAPMTYDYERGVFTLFVTLLEEDYPVRYRYFLRKEVWQKKNVWQIQWEGDEQPQTQQHDADGNIERVAAAAAASGKGKLAAKDRSWRAQLEEGARTLTLPAAKKRFVHRDAWKPSPKNQWTELPRGTVTPRRLRVRITERERIRQRRAGADTGTSALDEAAAVAETEELERLRQQRLAGNVGAELAEVEEERKMREIQAAGFTRFHRRQQSRRGASNRASTCRCTVQ
ncbi:hypothetical protein CDCA_CDCA07G2022 [Cyanidium caldarium]|uniref:Uncharacterized protein n=1 Tax=Cyanidium caldarium TaxID=2771 RepID=A0AAV9IUI8_CYACA|nr:hypothetical protein CDCA_CDCA07G2022 [Cyanidium caldarium]